MSWLNKVLHQTYYVDALIEAFIDKWNRSTLKMKFGHTNSK